MSEAQPPDLFLGQTLTELERLIVVKRDLCASKYINVLVNKKLREIMSRCTGANYIVSLDNFRRLAGILNSNKSANGVCLIFRQADLVDFLKSKVKQKVDSHPSNSMSEATQKSTLELFEDLEFWLLLKALLEESFALDKAFTDSITKIISFDVAACPLVTFPIPGSLRVVEVGAKVMKALPLQHRSKILQVIDSHIKGLATTDIECSAGYVHISGKSAAIDVGNGGVAPAGGQDHRELTIGKKAHAKAQIRHLEEQAVQYKATISGPHQDKDIWTQEKICLESRVRELIQKLSGIQSSDLEFQQENLKLHSQMAELKTANAGLEKKFRHSGSKDQTRIRKLEDEVAILRQALLDQKYAHDTDDKIYDKSFRGRAEKLTEELAEVEEDKAALARDKDRLSVEKASAEESLAESEDSKRAMCNEIHELGTENDRLEQELKDASDSLEEAEDDRATLSRNVKKLTSEKARLEKELAGAQDILLQISSFSSSIRPVATDVASLETNTNANVDTDSETPSTGVLTPSSSTPTTPR